jgi:hypothetical protein
MSIATPDHQLSAGGVVLGAIASELANTVIPALVGAEPEVLR